MDARNVERRHLRDITNIDQLPKGSPEIIQQEHSRGMESGPHPSNGLFIREATVPSTTNMSPLNDANICTLSNLTVASDGKFKQSHRPFFP